MLRLCKQCYSAFTCVRALSNVYLSLSGLWTYTTSWDTTPRYVPTEGVGPATDTVDFLLSPNAINNITSMLNPTAR